MVDAHHTLWVKLNVIHLRLMELCTDALLQDEQELAAWAEKVSNELQPFLKNTRRYHHGTDFPP